MIEWELIELKNLTNVIDCSDNLRERGETNFGFMGWFGDGAQN